ncbi:MAG: hypothetical protein ACI959_001023, partial [Limisphaerales bacterium]
MAKHSEQLRNLLSLVCFLPLLPMIIHAQDVGTIQHTDPAIDYGQYANIKGSLDFAENAGQWNDNVFYAAEIEGGKLFIESNALTWNFIDQSVLAGFHDGGFSSSATPIVLKGHAFKAKFNNTTGALNNIGNNSKDYHFNYLRGKNADRWASCVGVYEDVRLQSLYPGIDLKAYSIGSTFKYDFIVAPGANVSLISWTYDGLDNVELTNGEIKLYTSVNSMAELKPYAYQIIDGNKVEVECDFTLVNNTAGFEFPEGYNTEVELIIDPATLIFGSYSGSFDDNWGYTATYDGDGNLYGGGISFGSNYPLSTGAYQTTWAGGSGTWPCDISISKFSADGSTLIYSTFLGGSGNDLPHSMIATRDDELWLYGTTGSADFPVSSNAFDTTFEGGTAVTVTDVIVFPNGTDMFVTKLSADGGSLIGSSYLGGTANDGLNLSTSTGYNYGDHARGEIIIDRNGNAFIASTTLSTDFPTTGSVFQPSSNGNQDGIIAKINPDLTSLLFSTYIGGSQADAAYSMKLDYLGGLVVAGGTTSPDFPVTSGTYQTSYQGGIADGWIARIDITGSSILASSYMGTSDYDQIYFVEIDFDKDVYVTGQSTGSFPVSTSTGVYSNPGSSQFLAKMDLGLTAFEYSTVFGSGSPKVNIRPTAFLVDKCKNVYISGWGGFTNTAYNPNVQNTYGMPVTGDATQSTTDGSDFYFIVFERDAQSLLYATFFGGSTSREHVDGGTSRFDQKGIIYQAVCAGCGGNDDFPTTSGVVSQINNSSNCNLGVIKYEFDFAEIRAEASAQPDSIGCVVLPIAFQNDSENAVDYFWDFGDGSNSIDFEPNHVYTDTGLYQVMMIAIDSTKCIPADTTYLTITALSPLDTFYQSLTICEGESEFLEGVNQTIAGIYTDNFASQFGCDSVVITDLSVLESPEINFDRWICEGDSFFFNGNWINTSGVYTEIQTAANGCDSLINMTLNVNIYAYVFDSVNICRGDSVFIGGDWQNTSGAYLDTILVPTTCDTIIVTRLGLIGFDITDTLEICFGDSILLGGEWQTAAGSYIDTLFTTTGCDSNVTTILEILPPDTLSTSIELCTGDSILLAGQWQNISGVFIDTFTNNLGCDSIITTTLNFLPTYRYNDTLQVCEGDPILDITGAGGGLYVDSLLSTLGCDSIIDYFIIPLPRTYSVDTINLCDGDSIILGGVWANTGGNFNDTLVNADGCDSVIAVTILLRNTFSLITNIEICYGDSALIGVDYEFTAGYYADTLMAINGCDSIIGFYLITRPAGILDRLIEVCAGDSFFVQGDWQSDPGVYYDSLISSFGCDSIVRTILDTLRSRHIDVNIGICPG